MKKMFMIAILAIAGVALAVAQPRAVGGRLGYGAEVSYQHAIGSSNMVQVEVGCPAFNGVEAACTYDWIDPGNTLVPWSHRGEWHWYAGVGGAVGAPYWFNVGFIGACGRLGIEYDFWFPLQLSIDFRPTLGVEFTSGGAEFGWDLYKGGLGLGVRYKF